MHLVENQSLYSVSQMAFMYKYFHVLPVGGTHFYVPVWEVEQN